MRTNFQPGDVCEITSLSRLKARLEGMQITLTHVAFFRKLPSGVPEPYWWVEESPFVCFAQEALVKIRDAA
jgi:hypothetical protein